MWILSPWFFIILYLSIMQCRHHRVAGAAKWGIENHIPPNTKQGIGAKPEPLKAAFKQYQKDELLVRSILEAKQKDGIIPVLH